ncbi:MAG: tetratricopeptide repeat protein [Calditrichia bacterium]
MGGFKNLVFLIFLVTGFSFFLTAQEADSLISRGDSVYQQHNYPLALNLYSQVLEKDPDSYAAAWRLSRAYIDVGESIDNKDKRQQYYQKGEELARKAIELNPEGSQGHLFLSIALGRVALDAGAKERIKLSKEIKAEADRALELDPENDLAWHVLGRWNRRLASLSWVEKKFANMFLGGVPKDASVEKAAEAFRKAVELNPDYINHHLELAITLEKLDRKSEAMTEYRKVLELPASDPEDQKYQQMAMKKLDSLQ